MVACICLFELNLQAQNICGIDPNRISQLFKFGINSHSNQRIELKISDATEAHSNFSSRGSLKIPLVFHVISSATERYISDADIFDQIEILNRAFSGQYAKNSITLPGIFSGLIGSSSIEFCLASSFENGMTESPIIRRESNRAEIGLSEDLYNSNNGGSDPWDLDNYLNIWIADTGPNITGFASFPWSAAEFDGVVIHPSFFGNNSSSRYNQGKVLVHEIGHYLGLHHIWGAGMGCFEDDKVEDTPIQEKPYFGCPFFPQESCESIDMHMNYMDYVDDACMNLFTIGQIKRMEVVLEEFRPYLGRFGVECVDENREVKTVVLAPNPGTGHEVKIFLNEYNENIIADLKIYNSIGQLIKQERRLIYDGMIVNFETLVNGIYYFEIEGSVYKYLVIN